MSLGGVKKVVLILACLHKGLNGFHLPTTTTTPLSKLSNPTSLSTRGTHNINHKYFHVLNNRKSIQQNQHLRHRHQMQNIFSSQSLLFSTPAKDNNSDGLSPRPNRVKRIIVAIQRILARLLLFPVKASAKFSKLSRRAKSLVVMQSLIVLLLFGSMGRKLYVKYHVTNGGAPMTPPVELPYSSFLDLVDESGKGAKSSSKSSSSSSAVVVDNVRISPEAIMYRVTKPETPDQEGKQIVAYTRKVSATPELVDTLRSNSIPFTAARQRRGNTLGVAVRTVVLGFYMLILWRMYKTFSGNAGGASDTPGKLASTSSTLPLASFNDIQGIDEAKMEVMELVDTLRNPDKYAILGARAPKGLLLEGPPGTGKTMLARATAATAGVPLLYCSGSDFVEMFVGRGAARVRKLFERAARLSPCIIFVDELDALGKSRDMGNSFMSGRGNDEAEQTLNQLLACMDGLDSSKRICVLAATNRKEVLDSALIRPGRFDRIVKLDLPDAQGRENILRVHARKLPGFQEAKGIDERRVNALGKGNTVDLSAVAAVTAGLSGAELEFLVNEAAIRAVRRVSAALKNNQARITPNVRAEDFEASVQNYFATRKPKSGVNEVWKNVWKQP